VIARRRRVRIPLILLAGVGLLSACAGENLFTGLGTSVEMTAPAVDITTPTEGFNAALGDSLLVEANVNAPNGATSVTYSATYETDGEAAYTSLTETLDGSISVRLSESLAAVGGQVTGAALVVVEVTDQTGEKGADTVTVVIS